MKLGNVTQLGDCPVCGAYIKFRITEKEEIVAEKHNISKTHRRCKASETIVGYGEQHL